MMLDFLFPKSDMTSTSSFLKSIITKVILFNCLELHMHLFLSQANTWTSLCVNANGRWPYLHPLVGHKVQSWCHSFLLSGSLAEHVEAITALSHFRL